MRRKTKTGETKSMTRTATGPHPRRHEEAADRSSDGEHYRPISDRHSVGGRCEDGTCGDGLPRKLHKHLKRQTAIRSREEIGDKPRWHNRAKPEVALPCGWHQRPAVPVLDIT